MTKNEASPLRWQTGTIEKIIMQTPDIKSFFLKLSDPFAYIAGQHVDIRLTAPDGYVAMRSYSIGSSPDGSDVIELAIELLSDGEVSPYFHEVAAVGDEIELRGPLGGHFLWPEQANGPVLLIGAGSGLVPLMSMARYRRNMAQTVPTALILSSRTQDDVLFAKELYEIDEADPRFHLALAITREQPVRDTDFGRRIDPEMVKEVINRIGDIPAHVFICGSNGFVNIASDGALAGGIDSSVVKTERYGG